jgi:hypothetical protein
LSWIEGYTDLSTSSAVTSVDDMDRILDHLTARATEINLPFNVTLTRDDDAFFDIVVGADLAAVEWVRPEPRSCLVGVDQSISGEGDLIEFAGNGQYSELPRRYWIQTALAREAMRRYFHTGQLTSAVNWEPF